MNRLILLLLFSIIFTIGYSQKTDSVFQQKIWEGQLVDSTDCQKFDYHFYQAESYKAKEQYAEALEEYSKCMEIDSTNAALWYEMSFLCQRLERQPEAYYAILQAVRYAPQNDRYKEIEAVYCVSLKQDYSRAVSIIEKLSKKNPKNVSYLYQLLDLYQTTHNDKKFLSTIKKIEVQNGVQEQTSVMKISYFYGRSEHKKAIAEIHRLEEAFPQELRFKALLPEYYFAMEDDKKALQAMEQQLEKTPDNGYIFIDMFDYAIRVDNAPDVEKYAYKMLDDKSVDLSEKANRFVKYVEYQYANKNEDLEATNAKIDKFCEALVDRFPQEAYFYRLYSLHELYDKGDSVKAEELAKTAISLSPEDMANWSVLGDYYAEKNDGEKLDKLSEEAIKVFPQQGVWYYYRVVSQLQKDSIGKAISMIDEAVSVLQGNENNNFKSIMYSIKGDYLHQQGDYQGAFASYEQSLKYQPSNIATLNNYAYFLSECGDSLQKAENMSNQTILAEPKNHTYLDTYAWILFVRGNVRDARFYIEQALKYAGEAADSTLFDHYGDILFQQGEIEQALEQWQRALDKATEAEATELLKRKISEKQYIPRESPCR